MLRRYPRDYDFYPKTWLLPSDGNEFRQFLQKFSTAKGGSNADYVEDDEDTQRKKPAFIVKPEASCQGRGIFLTMTPHTDIMLGEHYVVQ